MNDICKVCMYYKSNNCALSTTPYKSDSEINCTYFEPNLSTVKFVEPVTEKDVRQELIDYLYDFNVRADIKIESLADDILTIVKK